MAFTCWKDRRLLLRLNPLRGAIPARRTRRPSFCDAHAQLPPSTSSTKTNSPPFPRDPVPAIPNTRRRASRLHFPDDRLPNGRRARRRVFRHDSMERDVLFWRQMRRSYDRLDIERIVCGGVVSTKRRSERRTRHRHRERSTLSSSPLRVRSVSAPSSIASSMIHPS